MPTSDEASPERDTAPPDTAPLDIGPPASGLLDGHPEAPVAEPDPFSSASVRVDRWLWAARLFKTRSQAAKACTAGHVKINDEAAKSAKPVKVGDSVHATTPGGVRILVVTKLADKRGPAAQARALYEDHSPPPPPREERAFGHRERGAGRPTKRDRRLLGRLVGRARGR
jgi:ribosome-associated heat shock protein Hsp15